jgi:hypothetical protein
MHAFLDGFFELVYRLTWGVSMFLALLVTVAPEESYLRPPEPIRFQAIAANLEPLDVPQCLRPAPQAGE